MSSEQQAVPKDYRGGLRNVKEHRDQLKAKLTAAEEQLAVLAEVLAKVAHPIEPGQGCLLCHKMVRMGYAHEDDCPVGQALSAAPKRGKVLWEKTVTFEIEKDGDVAGWCEDIADYVVFFIDRGELILGKPHIVTVREAADSL